MREYKFNFYNNTNLKSYDLTQSMRYQLGMLDKLDAFTRRHSEHVANVTCRICENLHMKSYFTVYCTICAYLHDIGKQFIPESILQKNGPLTDEEYEVIKTHTTIGYDICMHDPELRKYANGALYHHEALNGSGYPNGVTSKNIPLEGKIIRVADEFDAIVSKRQYKSHIGICETLNILREEALPPVHEHTKKAQALEELKKEANPKVNKIHPKIFKALVKVVIEDTEYEMDSLISYMKYLTGNIERLRKLSMLKEKMDKTSKIPKKEYFKAIIQQSLEPGETFDNLEQVLSEYEGAYTIRSDQLKKLCSEIKEIKHMK